MDDTRHELTPRRRSIRRTSGPTGSNDPEGRADQDGADHDGANQADRDEVLRLLGDLASRPLEERLSDRMRTRPTQVTRRPRRPGPRRSSSGVVGLSRPLLTPLTVVGRP